MEPNISTLQCWEGWLFSHKLRFQGTCPPAPRGEPSACPPLPPTWEALGLTQPDLCGRASSRAEGRGAGRSQLPWSCSSTGKAVWCSICTARASLHTSGDSRTPHHAQAVAMPVGAQRSEEHVFHLMAALRKGVLEQRCPAEQLTFLQLGGKPPLRERGRLV